MSFDYNVFKHVEFIEQDNGIWTWYCHSCGGTGRDSFSRPLDQLRDKFFEHVKESHKRTPEDMQDWSTC